MRYKSEYAPSYLLDPVRPPDIAVRSLRNQGTNGFHPLSGKIDKYLEAHPQGYHPFAEIESRVQISTPNRVRSLPRENEGGEDEIDMEDMEEINSFPSPPPPGFDDPSSLDEKICQSVLVLLSGGSSRRPDQIVRLGVSTR